MFTFNACKRNRLILELNMALQVAPEQLYCQ